MRRKEHTMIITLERINQAQAIALKKMFEYMEHLGSIGSSRMCSFYADGDGNFRPKVSIDYPEELPEVKEVTGIQSTGKFMIDFDSIACRIYD